MPSQELFPQFRNHSHGHGFDFWSYFDTLANLFLFNPRNIPFGAAEDPFHDVNVFGQFVLYFNKFVTRASTAYAHNQILTMSIDPANSCNNRLFDGPPCASPGCRMLHLRLEWKHPDRREIESHLYNIPTTINNFQFFDTMFIHHYLPMQYDSPL